MDTNTMMNVVETAVENKEIVGEVVKEGMKFSKVVPYVAAGVVVVGASYIVIKKIKNKDKQLLLEGEVADVIEPEKQKHIIFKKDVESESEVETENEEDVK